MPCRGMLPIKRMRGTKTRKKKTAIVPVGPRAIVLARDEILRRMAFDFDVEHNAERRGPKSFPLVRKEFATQAALSGSLFKDAAQRRRPYAVDKFRNLFTERFYGFKNLIEKKYSASDRVAADAAYEHLVSMIQQEHPNIDVRKTLSMLELTLEKLK